jgi:hypothetical protein
LALAQAFLGSSRDAGPFFGRCIEHFVDRLWGWCLLIAASFATSCRFGRIELPYVAPGPTLLARTLWGGLQLRHCNCHDRHTVAGLIGS